MDPALFLDRDGVLIENVDSYVRSWADVRIYNDTISVMARASRLPYKIVIITNQSAVGRGLITIDTAWAINDRLVEMLHDGGGRVDGVYMCTHAPPQGCECRKPRPGLIMQAASELAIDLSRSILIGDALTDIQAGKNAGVPTNILVLTGRGKAQTQLADAIALQPFVTCDRLEDAVVLLEKDLLSNKP